MYIVSSHCFKGKFWVPLGGYPSSCSPNITPYCLIQPLYNSYIGDICWYISRVLSQGTQLFPLTAALIQTLSQTNSLGVRMHLCPCDQMRMQLGGLLDMFGDHHAGAFELRSAKLLRVFRVFCRPANARKAITA